jgi:RNA polymerase sigma-70 factor (ECF subfamily)
VTDARPGCDGTHNRANALGAGDPVLTFGVLPAPATDPGTLVERVRQGDAEAESEFAALFAPRVRAMLGVRIRDREAARELANDVLMASLQALRQGQVREPGKLGAFVHGIARNLANNHLRRVTARPLEVPLAPESAITDPTGELEHRDRLARVRRVLAELEPMDRRILTEMLAEGRASVDIAASLGVTPEVVRTRKLRALRRIATLLGLPSRS